MGAAAAVRKIDAHQLPADSPARDNRFERRTRNSRAISAPKLLPPIVASEHRPDTKGHEGSRTSNMASRRVSPLDKLKAYCGSSVVLNLFIRFPLNGK